MRARLDRVGLLLSALCLVHCLTGLLLVAGLGLGVGLGATLLLDPIIHEVGLVLAIIVAAMAIGIGATRHRRRQPLTVALIGLAFMGAAVVVGHGTQEAVLTVIGVLLVATGHVLNLRRA